MDAIFAFHSIDDSGSVLSYRCDDLRDFVEGLRTDGVQVVTMEELLGQPAGRGHRAVLTFDDGLRSVHREALPVLAELGMPALVYVVSERVGQDNRWPGQPENIPRFELMDWDELRECRSAGLAIGAHTANHVHLDCCDESEWDTELRASRERLEDQLGGPVRHFAYPYGVYTDATRDRVGEVFDSAVTTSMSFVRDRSACLELPRIDTYYLQPARRYRPVFGLRSRAYLGLRAALRALKSRLSGGPS